MASTFFGNICLSSRLPFLDDKNVHVLVDYPFIFVQQKCWTSRLVKETLRDIQSCLIKELTSKHFYFRGIIVRHGAIFSVPEGSSDRFFFFESGNSRRIEIFYECNRKYCFHPIVYVFDVRVHRDERTLTAS